MAERSIGVVGAGIIGASLAYHLAGRGRPVTLIDAGLPGSGATSASFIWIGRPLVSDLPSAPLRYLAPDENRRLETELPELSIQRSGSISWAGFDERKNRPPKPLPFVIPCVATRSIKQGLRSYSRGAASPATQVKKQG
jgi:glycine/D-amino acid oxidase-like deaminating enzyme